MGGKSTDSNGDSRKYGETLRYDPDFNGPIKNRSCTDVICFAIFVTFIILWIILSILAFRYGNPEMLAFPTDSEGNVCGEGKFQDRPYLYFFDLTQCARPDVVFGCPTPQVCIQKCPTTTYANIVSNPVDSVFLELSLRDAKQSFPDRVICKYNADENRKMKELIGADDCAKFIFDSDPLMGRCIPFFKAINDIKGKVSEDDIGNLTKGSEFVGKLSDLKNIGEKLFADFKLSWPIIVIALLISMIVSLLWIIIMRWIAWIMVWLSIFLFIGLLAVGCWYSFDRYIYLKNHPDEATEPEKKLSFSKKTLESYKHSKNTWLAFGIISGVILIILLLLIIFLRNRIRLAIALIQESSKAVGSIMSSLFFPVFPFILQLGVIAFWMAVALHLSSAQFPKHYAIVPPSCDKVCQPYKNFVECEVEKFNQTCKTKCPQADCNFLKYDEHNIVTVGQVYNLFGLFWGIFFVTGLGEMVLAGAFATWYWTFDKRNMPTFVITASFCRTFRYHLGSLAFGSLLIAIVRMIRVLLEYIDRKLKEYSDNVATKIIMCCFKCCFWCLEKFLKFINRNAYIMISVYGKNFCVSAKNAFFLLMRNIARVVVLDKVTDFLLFIGKMTVVAGVGVLSFFYFNGQIPVGYIKDHTPSLNYPVVPVVVIIIGSYAIASCFFSVYSMAVDTLFLCFLEDCEMNDGSQEKPYRMSKNLMKILGKKNLIDPKAE
uniref:Choline transporter-like protein n=1 Tax=Hemiscolopendra marginata TaxID=943146 RepID=A0A646QCM2_9MYRI